MKEMKQQQVKLWLNNAASSGKKKKKFKKVYSTIPSLSLHCMLKDGDGDANVTVITMCVPRGFGGGTYNI